MRTAGARPSGVPWPFVPCGRARHGRTGLGQGFACDLTGQRECVHVSRGAAFASVRPAGCACLRDSTAPGPLQPRLFPVLCRCVRLGGLGRDDGLEPAGVCVHRPCPVCSARSRPPVHSLCVAFSGGEGPYQGPRPPRPPWSPGAPACITSEPALERQNRSRARRSGPGVQPGARARRRARGRVAGAALFCAQLA